MTKRKPLEWRDTKFGSFPGCVMCVNLMLSPQFTEAVASVSIEHPTTPGDLMRRTLDQYHADRHPGGQT